MSTTTTLARRRNSIALAAGAFNLLVGLTVLAGYALQNGSLVTFLPDSAPMRLTTAAAILCSGIAVLLLAAGALRSAAAAGAVCGAIGVLKLVEVIAGVHVAGLDPGSFGAVPPRAGLLIALLLLLAAAALVLMSGVVRLRFRLAVVGFAGSVLHSIGVVAVISYLAGVSSAFTTSPYSQLAIHTAAAIAVLGAALIRFAWRDSMTSEAGTPAWLPVLAGAGTLATSFCLYGAIAADLKADFEHQAGFEAEGLRQFLSAGVENRIQPLIRMARHAAAVPDIKKADWDADAQMILTRGGYQAIEWIDPAGKVLWTTPPGAGDAMPDGNAAFEPRRRAAFEAARQRRELAASRPVDLVTGGKGTIVLVPVFARDELAGYVAGVFRYHLLFQNLLASNASSRYAITIRDGSETLFSQGSAGGAMVRKMEIPVGGTRWTLEIAPSEALVVQARSPMGGAMLVIGGFLAVLFTLLVYLLQRRHGRGLAEQISAASAAPADVSRLPVVSYSRDGAALAWNESARVLFGGAAPRILACETGFRAIHVTVLRANASPGSLEALRGLLESCAQPALLFTGEGSFVAANPAAVHTLGWSEASIANAASGREALEIETVLLMQGQWSMPAAGKASTATA